MPPENLADVFVLYSELLQSQKPDQKYVDANIKTALCKYVLPALGYEVNRDNYLEIMKLVTIDQLKDLRSVQESYFSESKTKGQQRRTYRSHLNKLLEWCNSQRWWDNTLMGVLFSQYCPKYSPRKSPQKRGNLPHVRYKPLKD